MAILSALLAPLLLMFAGCAIDFACWNIERSRLKELADSLATRGAREFLLANANASQVKAVINSVLESDYPSSFGFSKLSSNIDVDDKEAEVSIHLTAPATKAMFLNKFEPFIRPHDVTSIAIAHGGMNVCVVALNEDSEGAVSTNDKAELDASPCSIFSNSKHVKGIVADKQSQIRSGLTCSAGGTYGASSNFAPAPTLDCPVYPDPLSSRPAPSVGACDFVDYEVGSKAAGTNKKEEFTISPGVYCGGLKIHMHVTMTFEPGVYIIKDGPLQVGKHSTLSGENIGFFLTGADAVFSFDKDSTITMTAPKDGPLAGIMFFEDRNAPLDRVHLIESENARKFLGTFYLSRGILVVNTQKPVADNSAYTAIVARSLSLKGKPSLVLNANYDATDIPVPGGVGPVGNTVSLRE